MTLTNATLSNEGFILTPRITAAPGICPQYGRELCLPKFYRESPPARTVGDIPDYDAFQTGVDIDVNGIDIKFAGSNHVLLPKQLQPFAATIQRCIDNERAIEGDNITNRWFILTITRSDLIPGVPHRQNSGAGEWHVHWPSARKDRAEKITVTRTYLATNFCGTEFFEGLRSDLQNRAIGDHSQVGTIPEGKISVMSSLTIHRCPTVHQEGRRTILIFSSRDKRSEEPSFSNPLNRRLSSSNDNERAALISEWRRNGSLLVPTQDPIRSFQIQPTYAQLAA